MLNDRFMIENFSHTSHRPQTADPPIFSHPPHTRTGLRDSAILRHNPKKNPPHDATFDPPRTKTLMRDAR